MFPISLGQFKYIYLPTWVGYSKLLIEPIQIREAIQIYCHQ